MDDIVQKHKINPRAKRRMDREWGKWSRATKPVFNQCEFMKLCVGFNINQYRADYIGVTKPGRLLQKR